MAREDSAVCVNYRAAVFDLNEIDRLFSGHPDLRKQDKDGRRTANARFIKANTLLKSESHP
jgi:hypothetical protein